jgi:hypothetical protein
MCKKTMSEQWIEQMQQKMAGRQTGISENQNIAEIKDSLQTLQTEQYIHRCQPIRFGLSFRYCLNDRCIVVIPEKEVTPLTPVTLK